MAAGALGLGSQGAGAGLSVGHERPAGWPAGSGGGEVGLELRRHIYVVETTEMVVGAVYEKGWLPGIRWTTRLSPRWGTWGGDRVG